MTILKGSILRCLTEVSGSKFCHAIVCWLFSLVDVAKPILDGFVKEVKIVLYCSIF